VNGELSDYDWPDDVAFEERVARWETLIRGVELEVGSADEWRRWIPLRYEDGTPIEERGNPIFDGKSDSTDRAFRIMQTAPRAGADLAEPVLSAWIKRYTREEGYDRDVFPAAELFIDIDASEESEAGATMLLRAWMTPASQVEDMEPLLRNTGA
jgi:hypothetical protein